MVDYLCISVLVTVWTLTSISKCDTGNLVSDYKHPDVEGERDKARIIGLCVGCGLALIFLIVLCISYNYYRNKSSSQQYDDDTEAQKKPGTAVKTVTTAATRPVTTATARPVTTAAKKPSTVVQSEGAKITEDTRF